MLKLHKSQSFSTDFIVAVVIFIGSIIFFYSLLKSSTGGPSSLEEQALFLARQTSEETSLIFIEEESTVNEEKLAGLALEDYEELKKRLNVRHDFIIHFEDKDGFLVPVNENTDFIGFAECRDNIIRVQRILGRKGMPVKMVVTICN